MIAIINKSLILKNFNLFENVVYNTISTTIDRIKILLLNLN